MSDPAEELRDAFEAGTPVAEIVEMVCRDLRRFGVSVDRSGWADLDIAGRAARVKAALDGALGRPALPN